MRIRVVRSARRHRIGNAHILAAMQNAEDPVVERNQRGEVLHYIGIDDRGVELHVVAVPDDRDPTGLVVIHAMPTAYRDVEVPAEDHEKDGRT